MSLNDRENNLNGVSSGYSQCSSVTTCSSVWDNSFSFCHFCCWCVCDGRSYFKCAARMTEMCRVTMLKQYKLLTPAERDGRVSLSINSARFALNMMLRCSERWSKHGLYAKMFSAYFFTGSRMSIYIVFLDLIFTKIILKKKLFFHFWCIIQIFIEIAFFF